MLMFPIFLLRLALILLSRAPNPWNRQERGGARKAADKELEGKVRDQRGEEQFLWMNPRQREDMRMFLVEKPVKDFKNFP